MDGHEQNQDTALFDAEGKFTDAGRSRLRESLGDDHKDFKGLDDVNDPFVIAKMYADTKVMVGKKMENVIAKPGENATDEETAAYHQSLREARNVPAEASTYELDKTDLPEGIEISEEQETFWKEAFQKADVNQDGVTVLFEAYKQERAAEIAAYQQAMDAAFQEESRQLQAAWKGDAMVENPRLAFNALNEFASDDLKKILKEKGVYSDPTNLEKWRLAGITPAQLHIWGNIGQRMKSANILSGGGGPAADDNSPRAAAMRKYPNRPELWPAE